MEKKELIGTIVGSIVGIAAFALAQKIFFKPQSFDKALMASASEINKTCPIMVDKYTRFDNSIVLPGNCFQYNYTLVSVQKSEVNLDTVKKYLTPGIINNVRTSTEMKIFRDHKVTMIYNYRDKNGLLAYKLTVTPDMYK